MQIRNIGLLLLLVIVSACANLTTVRHKPDYTSNIRSSNKVAIIIPPAAEVSMVGLSSPKRMYDFEYRLEDIIADQVKEALNEIGLKSKIVKRKNLHDLGILYNEGRLRSIYNPIKKDLYKVISIDEKVAYAIDNNISNETSIVA